ncbi:MAG: phage terminase small subunit P27 family [Desulfobacteraceae bacterium]|nr:phage terminase small subunit P27 family [Desulfobacteraceae bacterium]
MKEPKPKAVVPACVAHLNPTARGEWKRISKELHLIGLLSNIDRSALAAYCMTYARWVEAENGVKKTGLVIETKDGNVIQNPLVGIANTAMKLMHKFLTEFGMTPSSRSRISVEKPNAGKDPAESYFD